MKDFGIIVIHGLLMNKLVMYPLCKRLRKRGYKVHNYQYSSRKINIDNIADDLLKIASQYTSVIFIGHSLGGIVTREVLKKGNIDNAKAVFTLGTPHTGSTVARLAKSLGTGRILGNAGEIGLINNTAKTWEIDIDLHCIAGNKPIGVISIIPRLIRPHEYNLSDGTVMLSEASLPNATTTKVFRHSHTSMIYSNDVVNYISTIIQETQLQ